MMSLEEEALKNSSASRSEGRRTERPPRTFDRFVRVVATLMLVGILTVIYWIPLELMDGYIASAFVLAILTILGAGVASRLYHLRVRVQALEAILDDEIRRKELPAAPSSQTVAAPALEEIQKQP